jgi:hypothetical protein
MKISFIESLFLFLVFAYFAKYFILAIVYLIQESDIFSYMRGYIEVKYGGSKLEYLINCPYCLSYWAGLFLAGLFLFTCFTYNNIISYISLCFSLWVTASGISVKNLKDKENKQ